MKTLIAAFLVTSCAIGSAFAQTPVKIAPPAVAVSAAATASASHTAASNAAASASTAKVVTPGEKSKIKHHMGVKADAASKADAAAAAVK